MSALSHCRLGALALSICLALPSTPASADPPTATTPASGRVTVFLYTFADQKVLSGVELRAAGRKLGSTDARGVWTGQLEAGETTLTAVADEYEPIELPLKLDARESLQVSLSWYATRAPVAVLRGAISGETTVDLTPSPAQQLDLARDAALAVSGVAPAEETGIDSAPERQRKNETALTGVDVVGEALRTDDQAAFTEEKRDTAKVYETLSAEQIARAGDSDTAQALKRVTGLTLVDSRFVYVRGLGERYSSVLLNGAQIPSPDPTRRVVPLDLFPTDILEGVIVQKSYSAEMPGDFGGGTIQLRTRGYPDDFFLRISGTTGYVDGTTGQDGLTYDGGSRDWLGRDDGTRELPSSLAAATADGRFLREQTPLNPQGATPAQIEQYGQDLARGFDTRRDSIAPNSGFGIALGDVFKGGDGVKFGYIAALRYANQWDTREEKRQSFVPTNAGLELTDYGTLDQTTQQIDGSMFLSTGLDIGGDHHFKTTSMLLRQTTDEARLFDGRDDNQITRITRLRWIENSLLSHQLSGEHFLPALHDLELTWHYTHSKARRYAPDERRYRFDADSEQPGASYSFSQRSDNLGYTFGDLDDRADDYAIQALLPFDFGESTHLDLAGGVERVDRDREASIRRYAFKSPLPGGGVVPGGIFLEPSLERIFTDGNIDPRGFVLFENTRQTDNYFADQTLDAVYLTANLRWSDRYKLELGLRREDNEQQVTTFSIASATQTPVVARLEGGDTLPSATFTWGLGDNAQLRFAYGETVSRPDFRELSPAPFTDPEQDAETLGNPDLRAGSVKHYDARYEYYFDGTDAVSVAVFRKEFKDPIEVLRLPFLGTLLTLDNALTATNQGIELDGFKHLGAVSEWLGEDRWLGRLPWSDMHVGLNYAYIDSEVTLDPTNALSQTNARRPLQGQSPYVVNAQIGYQDPEGGSEWTLLFNRSGERIAQVGVDGAPDIYEQPFNQLDVNYARTFAENWKLKVKLRNLLDPEVEYRQGREITRQFNKGREIALTLEWLLD